MEKGIVVKSTGSWYAVKNQITGAITKCRIKGKFRIAGLKLTNPVAVGDIVAFEREDESTGIIFNIEPRTNYVLRQSPRKKHKIHLIASNVDQVVLIVTIVDPKLKQGFIDRFLLMTEPYDIPVIIVFNKCDVYEDKDRDVYHYLKAVYENINYKTLLVSAISGEGLDELKDMLKDKRTLISGQSGVGKSTLINAIESELSLKTTDLSDYTGKGQHTTTFAEMFELQIGGEIIDTPGIKTLSFNHLVEMDVAHNFREFFWVSQDCKYSNCTHINEPKCAVKDALGKGEISELRYNNYLQIIEEIKDQNYWELNTDF